MNTDYVVIPAILTAAGILIVALAIHRLRSTSMKELPTRRRILERSALYGILFVVVAVCGSSAFNALAIHRFWSSHPPDGQLVQVNGRRMHIDCTGSGSPTIVLDAELGGDSIAWGEIQPVLSRTTRVCSYDRAGFGWSEAQPSPRDADHIANELHQLLIGAGVNGPVVLMGHSITGLYLRDYASRYPQNADGMVLVDTSTPFQNRNPAYVAAGSKGPPSWLFRTAMILGVPRWIGMCSPPANIPDADYRKIRAEDICRMHYGAMSEELDAFDASSRETIHSESYGSLPILIISHDPAKMLVPPHTTTRDVARQAAWSQMQEDLKKLSTRARRIIAKGSTHNVPMDSPDLVDREVTTFINQVRGLSPSPVSYGGTISE